MYIPKNWQVGQPLKIRGEGFKTQDGTSGSVIAVKLNGGSLTPKQDATFEGKKGNSAGVWLYIQADANGNFTAEIPFPSADLVKGDNAPKAGEKVAINLLSGSMKKGDNARGGEAAEVTITEGGANAGGNANAGDNANANANAGGNANANAGGNANANGAAKSDANGIAAAKDSDQDSTVTSDSTTTSGGSTGTTGGEARGSGSATTAATKSSSRTLANTGASGMWVALGAGTAALVAGSVMVARRRTSA